MNTNNIKQSNSAAITSVNKPIKIIKNSDDKQPASFIRTSTLPRRFKEKFLNKYTHSSSSGVTTCSPTQNLTPSAYSTTSVNSQSSSVSNSSSCSTSSSASELAKKAEGSGNRSSSLKHMHIRQLQNLNKFVEKFSKAIKYLEQVILKKKYEIIASSITAILETILDIYTVIQSFDTSVISRNTPKLKSTNLIMTSSLFETCRSKINKSLASLIKWSDSILFLNSTSNNELFNEAQLQDSAKPLITQLNKSIKHLVKYLRKFFTTQEIWYEHHIDANVDDNTKLIPDANLNVSSSSSTSSVNDNNSNLLFDKQESPETIKNSRLPSVSSTSSNYTHFSQVPVTTSTVKTIDVNNGVKITHTTVKSTNLPSNTQITQTTTLTTTTTNKNSKNSNTFNNNNEIDPLFNIDSDLICNPVRLSAFIDLDRLVLELSSLGSSQPTVDTQMDKEQKKTEDTLTSRSTGFTNEQCNYLVSQFESFAKDFKRKETSNDVNSRASTIDRRTNESNSSTTPKKTTVYTNTMFKHDFNQNLCTTGNISDDKSLNRNDNADCGVVTKLVDNLTTNKTKFKETNIFLNQLSINDILDSTKVIPNTNYPKKISPTDDPVQTFTSLFDDPIAALNNNQKYSENHNNNKPRNSEKLDDSVDEEVDDDGNINSIIFGANKLNPNFLLIDDDDEEDTDEFQNQNDQTNKKKTQKKNFLVDDDEIDGYNDNIDTTDLYVSKKTNNDSLLSTWSLSTTSPVSSSSSSLSSLSNRADKNDLKKISGLESNNATIKKNTSAASLNSHIVSTPIQLNEDVNNQCNISSPSHDELHNNKISSPIFLTPSSAKTPTTTQSLSSASSSFSSLSCTNQSHQKPDLTPCSLISTQQKPDEQESNTSVLNLLEVTHLIEYQSPSSTSATSATLLNNSNANSTSSHAILVPTSSPVTSSQTQQQQNTNILRGGPIDALIVLATSAQTGVSGAQSNNGKSNTTSSINNLFSLSNNLSNQVNKYSNRTGQNNTKNNFLFQEAFLTTYRTIIEPIDLINKLIYRYRFFSKYSAPNNTSRIQPKTSLLNLKSPRFEKIDEKFDFNRIKVNIKNNKLALSAAKNSLALLVRVLDDLGNELNEKIVETFADFVYELLLDDELQLARLLRKKLINKLDFKRHQEQERETENLHKLTSNLTKKSSHDFNINSSDVKIEITPYLNTYTKRSPTLLDFKSVDLAEQMTLIDLNLFLKIELSEVLLWSTKQNEEFSPNLIQFTEHFNYISYWARSRILEHENPRDREKYIIKFLKIMKHLRKMNNFNSYLSILSAVDSGPIQRLDWPKNIIDSIKEFSVLIDPKCGFKSLREAVNEAQPPCIPHIGLILQDLTILHIANSDYLPSGNCNFWKRWQQFNILERLRFFRRCNYDFKKNEKIEQFFSNFEDFFNEDAQYSLSEQLKPRCKH